MINQGVCKIISQNEANFVQKLALATPKVEGLRTVCKSKTLVDRPTCE